MSKRKVVLFISMSLDGYIATKDHDLSWLSSVEQAGEDYGYEAFNQTVDTYIVGRKTYEVVLGLTGGEFPAAKEHKCFVITRREKAPENGVVFHNGDLQDLIHELQNVEGKNIYCDGGSEIVRMLLDKNLIDEFIISVIPILLGDGIKLFKPGEISIPLKLLSSAQYKSGLVQLHYINKR